MAEEDDNSQEKTEEATPRRLEKAKEEGQTARSKELATMAVLLAGAGLQPVATPDFAADEARHLIAGEGGPNGRLAGGQPAEVLAHRLEG